jgi:hypothetical protein
MVCVPSRGALFVGSGVPAVRFSVPSAHARGGSRGPRDVAAFPASSSGRGNFSAPPPVMAHSAAGGSLERGCRSPVSGFQFLALIQALLWFLTVPGPGLVPLGSAKHLPASHDAGFTALHPLSGLGKRCACPIGSPVGFLVRFLVLALLRRSWCLPLAVSRFRLPAPARWVRCDAVLVTVNCLPMFLERGMGLAEVAS